MRLIAPADKGEWFLYSQAPAAGGREPEKVEFEIRRLPAKTAKEIDYRHHGRTRKAVFRKGARVLEYDVAQLTEEAIEKATCVLLDSRNAEIPATDVPSLASTADAAGYVKLDGKWTPEVKAEVFAALPKLAAWIVDRADSLETSATEDEEGKGETS